MSYASISDVYDKVEWEGGLWAAVFDYGIRAADLPDGTDPGIVAAWTALEGQAANGELIEAWLEANEDEGREYDLSNPLG
jgi:hypothetical protein